MSTGPGPPSGARPPRAGSITKLSQSPATPSNPNAPQQNQPSPQPPKQPPTPNGSNGRSTLPGGAGRFGIPPSSITPDIVYKMSKKIAQLTKVIYFLNTKQEDHVFEVQSLTSIYEDEIDTVVSEANTKLADLDTKVAAAEANMTVYEDTIKTQLEKLSRLERALDDERERSDKLERRYDMDVSLLQSQVDTVTSEAMHLQNRVDSLVACEKKLADLEVFHAKTVVEMDEAKKKALEELAAVKDKHFELQQEVWEREKGKLEDQLRGEITGLEKKIDELHENHTAEVNALNLQHDMAVAALKTAHTVTVSRLENTLSAAQERLDLAEQNIQIQSTSISRLQGTIDDLSRCLDEERNKSSALEGVVKKLEGDADERTKEMDEMRKINDDQGEAARYPRRRTQLSSNLWNFFKAISIRNHESTIQSLKLSLASSTAKLDSLLAAYATLQETHTESLADIERLKDEIGRLKVKEAELAETRKYVGKLERELERARMHSNEALNERQNEMEARIQEEINIARGDFQVKLDQQIVVEKALARKEVIADIERLETTITKLQKDLADADARTAEVTQRLTRDIQTVQEELEHKIRQGEAEFAHLKKKLDDTVRTAEAREADYQAADKVIRDLRSDIESLEIDKADMIQKMMRLDAMIKEAMRAEAAREREELEQAWQKRVAEELEKLRRELKENHSAAVETLRQELEQEHVKVIGGIQEVHTLEQQNWNDERGSMAKRLSDWEEQHVQSLDSMDRLKEQHAAELDKLTSDFASELARACTEWSLDSTARETQLRAQAALDAAGIQKWHSTEMMKLRESHSRELQQLRLQHAEATDAVIRELEARRGSEIAALMKEHVERMEVAKEMAARKEAETVLQLNVEKMAEVKEAKEELGKQLRDREEEIEKLRTAELDYVSKNTELNETIDSHSETIRTLEQSLATHNAEIGSLRQDMESKIRDAESAADKRHKEDLSRVRADHVKEAQVMLKEFERAQGFLRKRIGELEKSLDDAAAKYINRESREEDVRKIAELEEELKRRKRAIATLKDEIDHYRLELNNREANFNRIFNARPVVGVLPSADPHVRKALKQAHTRSEPALQTPKLPPLYGVPGASMELH
ncbi:hypothetical protein M427DRAFT_30363 [Gonapodya prolifera JEL478]|uniref:Protein FAM184A/B N-terminal domain-containing protein n=1 Tax=Gonapodya prolifera (strain JEL478) TaxID=1344416 RepID=A0A139AL89_GONPJ|nr:hypothetical protein M427DRAFT_30363 [Gonapodya prolifera JEL478]|eukprot:KXS17557.1 hypothetical protein M427DRAFT_30363 [Gonapodya prolifera JEL478]